MEVKEVDSKKYKLCCGNCKYYDRSSNKGANKCLCDEKIKSYKSSNRFLRKMYPSDEPCTYFSFEPHMIHLTKEDRHNKKLIEAAKLLKQNCGTTKCGQCIFWDKDNKWCKLETKKDYNFNTVPRDWNI